MRQWERHSWEEVKFPMPSDRNQPLGEEVVLVPAIFKKLFRMDPYQSSCSSRQEAFFNSLWI